MTPITPSAFKAVQDARAKVCEDEAETRLQNAEAAKNGSRVWGDPDAAKLAQGHKAVTATILAKRLRSLTPSSIPGLIVKGDDDAEVS